MLFSVGVALVFFVCIFLVRILFLCVHFFWRVLFFCILCAFFPFLCALPCNAALGRRSFCLLCVHFFCCVFFFLYVRFSLFGVLYLVMLFSAGVALVFFPQIYQQGLVLLCCNVQLALAFLLHVKCACVCV